MSHNGKLLLGLLLLACYFLRTALGSPTFSNFQAEESMDRASMMRQVAKVSRENLNLKRGCGNSLSDDADSGENCPPR